MPTNLEFIQRAIRELGAVTNDELSAFVKKKYGVTIDPKFMPIYRASLVDHQRQPASGRPGRVSP